MSARKTMFVETGLEGVIVLFASSAVWLGVVKRDCSFGLCPSIHFVGVHGHTIRAWRDFPFLFFLKNPCKCLIYVGKFLLLQYLPW